MSRGRGRIFGEMEKLRQGRAVCLASHGGTEPLSPSMHHCCSTQARFFTQLLQMSSAWHKRLLFGLALIRDLPRGPSAREPGWSWSRWGQGARETAEGKQETSCKGVSRRGDKIEGEMQNMMGGRQRERGKLRGTLGQPS